MTGRQCSTVIVGAWVWIAGVMVAVTWPSLHDWAPLTVKAGVLATVFMSAIWRLGQLRHTSKTRRPGGTAGG